MCGSPAVPSISASPSDIASNGFDTSRPGPSTATPYWSDAALNNASGLNPNRDSAITASRNAPLSSRTALTICTHVVAIMPPKST